jgi:hypothetical protein
MALSARAQKLLDAVRDSALREIDWPQDGEWFQIRVYKVGRAIIQELMIAGHIERRNRYKRPEDDWFRIVAPVAPIDLFGEDFGDLWVV